MSPGGYESDSTNSSSENLLESILAEEEEFRRGRIKKLRDALVLTTLTLYVGLQETNDYVFRNFVPQRHFTLPSS